MPKVDYIFRGVCQKCTFVDKGGSTLGENGSVFSISEIKNPTMVIFTHVGYVLMYFWNFEKKKKIME